MKFQLDVHQKGLTEISNWLKKKKKFYWLRRILDLKNGISKLYQAGLRLNLVQDVRQ